MTIPPLLALAEGRRVRPRKALTVRPKEIVLHMQIAALLRACGAPGWRWCHVANGEHRDVRVAAKLKRMGVQRGWPDYTVISPAGIAHFLELKRAGGRLSSEQEDFQRWAAAHGIPFSCADRFELAVAALRHWGVLKEAAQ